MKCLFCATESKNDKRTPHGWHRDPAGNPVCEKCWDSRYVLRAVTFPVVGPVGKTWDEFRPVLNAAWSASTSLSNWLMTELYARDVRRQPGMEKLPPMLGIYLYPEARARFRGLASRTIATMEHAVSGKYRAARYKVIWTCEASLPTFRYPTPYAVPNQGWKAHYGQDNVPLIDLRVADERWTLRLRGGKHYRRQLAAFQQIVEGMAVQGELSIYRRRASSGDHRNSVTDRDGGGNRQQYRVMAKLVVWQPRPPAPVGKGALFVRTDKDSLLIALNAKEERVWAVHADHVRRWVAEHTRRLSRWSDDTKAEQCSVAPFQSRREAAVIKHRRRVDSTCHEVACQLANYAARHKFAVVRYNDMEHGFCTPFPWDRLRRLIAEKLDVRGIAFELVDSSGSLTPNRVEPLANSKDRE